MAAPVTVLSAPAQTDEGSIYFLVTEPVHTNTLTILPWGPAPADPASGAAMASLPTSVAVCAFLLESGGADSLVAVGVRAGLASTWAKRRSRVDLEGAPSLKPPRLVCIRAPYSRISAFRCFST